MERTQLKVARLEKGLTQEQVAEQIEVETITYRRWELGKHAPQLPYQKRLCQLFGRTPQELGFCLTGVNQGTISASNVSAPPEAEGDADEDFRSFCTRSLVLRLQCVIWKSVDEHSQYQMLQDAFVRELEDKSMQQDSLSRREALRLLAANSIAYCGLSALVPVLKRPIEEILTQCAAGITACWQLRKGKDLAFASSAVAKYIPTLKEIVQTGSAPQRKAAADLLVQSLLLKSTLSDLLGNNGDEAARYAQQAEMYSSTAENPSLQILALSTQAAVRTHANQWKQSLSAAEKARSLMETLQDTPIPPKLQSKVYSGLANYLAYHGQKQDAFSALEKAHAMFYVPSSSETTPAWIDHSEAVLFLNDGKAHLHLDTPEEALNAFTRIHAIPTRADSIDAEAFIYQAMAEINRDVKSRDMEWCVACWQHGIAGAIELRSGKRYNEAAQTYAAMRAVWPGEQRIKDLRTNLVHW